MSKKCSVSGCDRKHAAKGFCKYHYNHCEDRPICAFNGCNNKIQISYPYCSAHLTQKRRTGTMWVLNSHRQNKICNVPGCEKAPWSRNLCKNHFMSWQRGAKAEKRDRKCSIHKCKRIHMAKGMCSLHYLEAKSLWIVPYGRTWAEREENKGQKKVK